MIGGRYPRGKEAAQRFSERRLREIAAPRLLGEVPALVRLQIAVEQWSSQSDGSVRHVRHVVVSHAPALFIVACSDSRCTGGGHDITAACLRALRAHATRFSGEDACGGMVGSAPCCGQVRFEGEAEFRAL